MYTYIFLSEILWYSEDVLIRIDVLYVYLHNYIIYIHTFLKEIFQLRRANNLLNLPSAMLKM